MEEAKALVRRTELAGGDPSLQVYASYKYARELGEGATGQGLPSQARPLRMEEAERLEAGGVPLQPLAMRQGVAWQLACRQLLHHQHDAAGVAIKADTKAGDIKDLHVALQVAGSGLGGWGVGGGGGCACRRRGEARSGTQQGRGGGGLGV